MALVGLGVNNCDVKIVAAPIVPAIELGRGNGTFIVTVCFETRNTGK